MLVMIRLISIWALPGLHGKVPCVRTRRVVAKHAAKAEDTKTACKGYTYALLDHRHMTLICSAPIVCDV